MNTPKGTEEDDLEESIINSMTSTELSSLKSILYERNKGIKVDINETELNQTNSSYESQHDNIKTDTYAHNKREIIHQSHQNKSQNIKEKHIIEYKQNDDGIYDNNFDIKEVENKLNQLKNESKSQWICNKCTFQNQSYSLQCIMCSNTKIIETTSDNTEAKDAEQKSDIITFKYSHDFDKNGVLYYLGCNRDLNNEKYINPVERGSVIITSAALSSRSEESSSFIGRETVHCITKSKKKSGFKIKLKNNVKIRLTHYTLRHYNLSDHILRHWKLEGNNDNKEW
eukprot:406969_1